MSVTQNRAVLLERSTTALVVVDPQAKLLPVIHEADQVVKNIRLLLQMARLEGLPRLLTTQYAKGLGGIVPEIMEVARDLIPLDKTSFGCFGEPDFLRHLKETAPRANTLLVTGVETHVCVTQTVLGALNAGYLVHVAADAVSSRTPENRQIGLRRMELAGAVVSSTEMMIYELLGKSGTPEFKALLALVK